jgi:hypothetical protein
MKGAFIFEPLAAPFISRYLRRQLNNWKKGGKLDDYRVHTTRIKQYHYIITMDLDLTPQQSRRLFHQMFWIVNNRCEEVTS